MPVSGTVTLWRIASIPRGVLAMHRRLSLKGYLLQMDLFPNRESEGVSALNGRIRRTFWFPGSASASGICRMGKSSVASPPPLALSSLRPPLLCMNTGVADFSNPRFTVDRSTGVPRISRGTSKRKPKPKAKDAPPSRAAPTSGAIPRPTPAYRKHKLASLSPAASPAPASSRTISQVAAMPDSQASSKHQRLDLLPPLLRALTIGETNVHHGHFVNLTPERLGFDPIRTETASPPESEARTDEELFAAGARLLDEELTPFCGPAYYGLRDFTCPATYDILQPAFERGIALGLLVMRTCRWLDSLAYFNYHSPKLVDPLDMAIPPDDQLVLRAAFIQPDVAVAQTFPVLAGASVEEEEEIRERNREQTRLAVRINREHNEAAEEAYAAATRSALDFEAEHLHAHKHWACYEEDRVVFLHQYVIISNTFLSYASWHHSTTVSASSARASTSAKPTVAKSSAADLIDLSDSPPLDPSPAPLSGQMVNGHLLRSPPVTVHEIADTESSREGSQYGDGDVGDSDQLDEGEDEVDPPVSAKAAGKHRARVSGGNNDWSKFEEEKCGYVLVGSRVKQAADSVECAALLNPEWVPKLAKKGAASALDDDEWNHLAFLLEEHVWEITGPHLLPPPRDLTAKPAVTPNGYFLSLSNPKYVAGLKRYHIQPAHFGALSYFVRGQGCTQCCDDDEPCIRIFKGHQLNRGCTTCAIRNWSCIAVMPFSDVDWARTDDYLQDINVEFFLYQQARAAQVFQCVTGMKYSNVAYNTARPLFGGDEGVIAIPEVNEKGERMFSIAPDSPTPTVQLPTASKPPSPQHSSPARAVPPLFPHVRASSPPSADKASGLGKGFSFGPWVSKVLTPAATSCPSLVSAASNEGVVAPVVPSTPISASARNIADQLLPGFADRAADASPIDFWPGIARDGCTVAASLVAACHARLYRSAVLCDIAPVAVSSAAAGSGMDLDSSGGASVVGSVDVAPVHSRSGLLVVVPPPRVSPSALASTAFSFGSAPLLSGSSTLMGTLGEGIQPGQSGAGSRRASRASSTEV
ncbi:hypothetical protein C8J57DRAFT_1228373 [Mycena rebaudengoi]|nr:hypothetical protein C8J57DRAFT_1228373 [Mycena rebaudengoi]